MESGSAVLETNLTRLADVLWNILGLLGDAYLQITLGRVSNDTILGTFSDKTGVGVAARPTPH
jgi:hypothetical protein